MTRLIDADELKELIDWTFAKPPFSRKTIKHMIDMARTVDAVPVIRCKDCAWHKEKRCTVWRERAVIVECYTDDEGYCYLAKEKDDV